MGRTWKEKGGRRAPQSLLEHSRFLGFCRSGFWWRQGVRVRREKTWWHFYLSTFDSLLALSALRGPWRTRRAAGPQIAAPALMLGPASPVNRHHRSTRLTLAPPVIDATAAIGGLPPQAALV